MHYLERESVGRLLICEPNLESHSDFDLIEMAAAVEAADIVVVLVDHLPFRALRAADLKGKVVIDTRGVVR